jgi:OmpA-OmpF porin, OOP family
MFFKRFFIFCVCVLLNQVWAQTDNSVVETAGGRVTVLGHSFATSSAMGSGQVRIVLYSGKDLALAGATSVFVNGIYHASLIPGAYSELCYAPGPVELGVQQVKVGRRSKRQLDAITAMDLQRGQTHYLRVRVEDDHPLLEPVSAELARRELPTHRLQLHTISRVAQPCMEVAAAPAPAIAPVAEREPVSVRHVIPAHVLFAFGRSDRRAVLPSGWVAIDQVIAGLKDEYSRVDQVHVVGYADPIGRKHRNQRLSEERASTVRQYIDSTRVLTAPLSAEGLGSREPVVTHCSRSDSPQARRCHQPNRRVVIEVTGVRR